MTLATHIILEKPTDARAVFDLARALIGATDTHPWQHVARGYRNDQPQFRNQADVGLCGLLDVTYGADGPLVPYPCECDPGECNCPPAGAIEVTIDTAYGYRADNGAGCSDLHAAFVTALGAELDRQGIPWQWQDEFTGIWHRGYSGLDTFGDVARGMVALSI